MFAEELKRVFRRPRNIIILGLIALVPITKYQKKANKKMYSPIND